MKTISLVIAFLKAIPIIEEWFQKLVAAYVAARISSIKKEYKDSIKKAFDQQDQRPIEEALGNPDAGAPSGIPGTEIRDSLPGVK